MRRSASPTRHARFAAMGLLACLALTGGMARAAQPGTPSPAADSGPAARGFAVMADRRGGNCIACHAIPGIPGAHGNFGPDLRGVAARHVPAQLRQWVQDARVIKPGTLMPPFGTLEGIVDPIEPRPILSPAQVDDVAAALATLTTP